MCCYKLYPVGSIRQYSGNLYSIDSDAFRTFFASTLFIAFKKESEVTFLFMCVSFLIGIVLQYSYSGFLL